MEATMYLRGVGPSSPRLPLLTMPKCSTATVRACWTPKPLGISGRLWKGSNMGACGTQKDLFIIRAAATIPPTPPNDDYSIPPKQINHQPLLFGQTPTEKSPFPFLHLSNFEHIIIPIVSSLCCLFLNYAIYRVFSTSTAARGGGGGGGSTANIMSTLLNQKTWIPSAMATVGCYLLPHIGGKAMMIISAMCLEFALDQIAAPTLNEAKGFNLWKLLGIGRGGVDNNSWAISSNGLMCIALLMGLQFCFFYWLGTKSAPIAPHINNKEEPKMETIESLKHNVSSTNKWIMFALISIGCSIGINLVMSKLATQSVQTEGLKALVNQYLVSLVPLKVRSAAKLVSELLNQPLGTVATMTYYSDLLPRNEDLERFIQSELQGRENYMFQLLKDFVRLFR